MKYYQYFLKILLKYKWALLATVGISVAVAVLFCKFATPLYKSTTEIYPLVMKKGSDMTTLNPCYLVQRIAHSRQFRQLLLDTEVSPSLNLSNYDRRIGCHETPRHTLVITACAETPEIADTLAKRYLDQLDFAATSLTSVRMMQDSGFCEQIPWPYYHRQVDFAPDSPEFDSCDNARVYFLFDTLSAPTCAPKPVYPPDMLKTAVLVFLISAFLAFVGVCLFEEIRNRFASTHAPNE